MSEQQRSENRSTSQAQTDQSDPPRVALILQKHWGGVPYKNVNPLLGLAGVAVVIGGFVYAERAFGRAGFWGLFCLFIGVAVVVTLQAKRRDQPERTLSPEELSPSRDSGRLTARGKIRELSYLADIEDVPFEPVIVERFTTASSFLVVFLAGFFAVMALQCGLGYWIPFREYVGGLAIGIGVTIYWLCARLRPLYYRIVPGRMDVMRFSVLSGKATLLRRVDLRDATVEVSFAKNKVFLHEPGGASEVIGLSALTEPFRFARAILQAAICTSPAPPLPDGQLLG